MRPSLAEPGRAPRSRPPGRAAGRAVAWTREGSWTARRVDRAGQQQNSKVPFTPSDSGPCSRRLKTPAPASAILECRGMPRPCHPEPSIPPLSGLARKRWPARQVVLRSLAGPNGSLLIRAAGRGGVADLRQARQAALAAAGAAALATTTASSATARSRGSARPAPPVAPPARSSWLVRRGCPVGWAPRAADGAAACSSDGAGWAGSAARKVCQQNENAQHTSAQWRRIARSERPWKSAQPPPPFPCLYPSSPPLPSPYSRTTSARFACWARRLAGRERLVSRYQLLWPGSVAGGGGGPTRRSRRSAAPPPPSAASAPHQVSVWPSRKRRWIRRHWPGRLGPCQPSSAAASVGVWAASAGAQVPLRGLRASTNGTLAVPSACVKP